MIASCNFLDIGLFNSSNSFRMKKMPSADSNVVVRSAIFYVPNLTGSNDETR